MGSFWTPWLQAQEVELRFPWMRIGWLRICRIGFHQRRGRSNIRLRLIGLVCRQSHCRWIWRRWDGGDWIWFGSGGGGVLEREEKVGFWDWGGGMKLNKGADFFYMMRAWKELLLMIGCWPWTWTWPWRLEKTEMISLTVTGRKRKKDKEGGRDWRNNIKRGSWVEEEG